MLWGEYAHGAQHAIVKGAESLYHGLETALGVYSTLHGAYQLAGTLGSGIRALAPAAAALL